MLLERQWGLLKVLTPLPPVHRDDSDGILEAWPSQLLAIWGVKQQDLFVSPSLSVSLLFK